MITSLCVSKSILSPQGQTTRGATTTYHVTPHMSMEAVAAGAVAVPSRASLWWFCAAAVVGSISIAVYADTLNAGFVWDDRAAVMGNADVRGETPWGALLSHDFWGQQLNLSYVRVRRVLQRRHTFACCRPLFD